jgi:aryl-alcohol dehydrogenase-like predicted oxidoreductase
MVFEKRALGKTEVAVTPVGLGCWQFSGGSGLVGGYWEAVPQDTVNQIVVAALERGINWFDTAEIYGRGRSEIALAQGLAAAGRKDRDVVVATKWWPVPRTARSILSTIGERQRCLDGFSIDLYQVHQPYSFSSVEAEMDAMAELLRSERIRAVGVSNFSAKQMRRAHVALARHGIPLASNQVSYSLLKRGIETNGVLAAARELGVTIIAYSPLAQGILSGKFHDDPQSIRSRPGPRRYLSGFQARGLARSLPVVSELRRVGAEVQATASQVALCWLLQMHGDAVVVIPGATRTRHVEEAAGAMAFRLSPEQLERLDRVSRAFR